MRIKLSSAIAGENFAHAAGDTIDWPDEEALRFIAKGLATRAATTENMERQEQRRAEKR